MRKLLSIFAIVLLLSGCAFFQAQKANWTACRSDPVCLEKAKNWQSKTELLSLPIAAAIPVPGAAAAPKILGYVVFGAAMLLGGRALRKKREIAPV